MVFVVLSLLFGLFVVASFSVFNNNQYRGGKLDSFYVGVTYCGGSVEEAKELVDSVKGCTNLFVLLSGPFMWDAKAMEEIGDYVVSSGLSYAVSCSVKDYVGLSNKVLGVWLLEAKERWGEQFIGIYYGDEAGGDMLDDKNLELEKRTVTQADGTVLTINAVSKWPNAIVVRSVDNPRGDKLFSSTTVYYFNGTIWISNIFNDPNHNDTSPSSSSENIHHNNHNESSDTYNITFIKTAASYESINYYPNGSVTITENMGVTENFYTSENITKYPWPILPYEELLKKNPIQNFDDAAKVFENMHKQNLEAINKKQLSKKDITVFTADYGLYWWNYKGGYDIILAELAWNNSATQQIGLVRGAANLQNKQWGTILTWKYTHPPYLTDGEEMFEQMKISYETGAQCVIIFNFSENLTDPNTLQEEHFVALERFWNEIVQNPEVKHGSIKAEAVLILPKNYGWGMRNPKDGIWGIWHADNTTQELWDQIHNKIDQYGLKLDIIFEDPNYAPGNYKHIYYWNQK